MSELPEPLVAATSRHIVAPEDQATGLAAEAWPIRFIEPASDGSWSPAETGLLAALYPVELDGEIIDIVAWELAGNGSPWWLRTGAVAWLGQRHLDRCRLLDKPLRLVPTPKEWLADRGEAFCILDWRTNVRELLAGLPEVVTTHPALKARLERALAEPQRTVPRVA